MSRWRRWEKNKKDYPHCSLLILTRSSWERTSLEIENKMFSVFQKSLCIKKIYRSSPTFHECDIVVMFTVKVNCFASAERTRHEDDFNTFLFWQRHPWRVSEKQEIFLCRTTFGAPCRWPITISLSVFSTSFAWTTCASKWLHPRY